MRKMTHALSIALFLLGHLSLATTVIRGQTLDVAAAKYDRSGSYGTGSGGYSNGGGGYSSGGGGYSSGGGGYSSGAAIGYSSDGGGGSYGSSGYGGGGYSAGDYGGGGYGMMTYADDGGKDKDEEKGIIGIIIAAVAPAIIAGLAPAILAVVIGIPVLLLALAFLGALLAFLGRNSNEITFGPFGGIVDLGLIRTVSEAAAASYALSTDEVCRQRVICEMGHLLKSPHKRATVISVLDAMVPKLFQKHLKPLKEVWASDQIDQCHKYVCKAAVAAMRAGPLRTIFGPKARNSSTTPDPGTDSGSQNSSPEDQTDHRQC